MPSLGVPFDVVVVGGGIAGLSAAWALAASARVAVVETEPQLGVHATGRSAAMLNVTSGPEVVCRLAALSRAFLRSPGDDAWPVSLLSPRGLLWVGRAGTSAVLEATRDKAPEAARLADGDEARRLVPRLRHEVVAGGAVHEPDAMAIDAAALLDGYRRGLGRRGGVVLTSAEAVRFERDGTGWTVIAGPHRLPTDRVVNAAGAWGDMVAERAGVRPLGLRPLRRTAALVPAPEDLARAPMVMDVEGQWYAGPETGGLLISAAGEALSEAVDARPEELEVAIAIERVNAALDVDIRSVRRSWAGLRTFTLDRVPAVGPDPDEPRFVWLVGQGGSGIKTAPALAEIVAESIIIGRPIPADLAVERFR